MPRPVIPSLGEAEAGGLAPVRGQLGLRSEPLSPKSGNRKDASGITGRGRGVVALFPPAVRVVVDGSEIIWERGNC